MTMTGLETFDRTLQMTNICRGDLMEELRWSDRQEVLNRIQADFQNDPDIFP